MAQVPLARCNRSLSSCVPRVFRVTCREVSHRIKRPRSFSGRCGCCRLGMGDQRTGVGDQRMGHAGSRRRATVVAWVTAAPLVCRLGWANRVVGVNTVHLEIALCSRCLYSTVRKWQVLLSVASPERTVLIRGARWRGGSRPALPASWRVSVFNALSCSDPWQASDAVGLGSAETALGRSHRPYCSRVARTEALPSSSHILSAFACIWSSLHVSLFSWWK